MEAQLNELLGTACDPSPTSAASTCCWPGSCRRIRKSDLGLSNMVDKDRYHRLNAAISDLRGTDVDFYIKGVDELRIRHDSVMVEACNASFQVHLQVDPATFANQYNIAQVLAGPVLACATNSPLLFGRRLWAETRIAVFQQAVDTRRPTPPHARRRSAGHVRRPLAAELDPRALPRGHRPLPAAARPTSTITDPFESLGARARRRTWPRCASTPARCGVGTAAATAISDGVPHLRIENRVLPAGPDDRSTRSPTPRCGSA